MKGMSDDEMARRAWNNMGQDKANSLVYNQMMEAAHIHRSLYSDYITPF
jgi:hypothetical protein